MAPTPPPPPTFPSPLPYPQASTWQQRRAAFSAGQLLEPAFPYLGHADWQRALDVIQPALYVLADQVLLTHDGLAQVIHHVATAMPAAPPQVAGAAPLPARRRKGSRQPAAPPSPLDELEAALLVQLTNISHWRSLPLRQVTVEVVTLGLRHFPDAQRPKPPEDLF